MTTTAPPPDTLAAEPGAIVISQYEVLLGDIQEAQNTAAAGVTFNYADPKDNKLARSYIFGIRKIKARIESARKEAKAWALEYGRAVDGQARDLIAQVDELIEPHQTAIDAITQAEARRVAKHREAIDTIKDLARVPFGTTADSILQTLNEADQIDVDSLEEFAEEGKAALLDTVRSLGVAHAVAEKREQEALELAQLREAARIQQEKDAAAERERQAQERADAAAVAVVEELERKAAAAEAKVTEVTGGEGLHRPPHVAPAPTQASWPAPGQTVEKPTATFQPTQSEAVTATLADRLRVELLEALTGKTRREIVDALLDDTLHFAVVVMWGRVE